MTEATLTQRLKAQARILGFHAVGVAPAGTLEGAASALPGAKSVVAVALSYLYRPTCVDCEDFTPGSPGPRGRVSRFAWGSDYHQALNMRLGGLADWLREPTGGQSVISADTGPLMDRVAAQQAGIGWYGKNCAIIVPNYGSWVVLGELITTAELDYDQSCNSDRCGSCQLCMKACPTGAITEPFVVDATRCVSYLTQMKGYAPRGLRESIGDRIYGCDVCQDVCPQNRSILPTDAPEFQHPAPPGRRPALLPLLNMTREEFRANIASNTMGWIKLTRLRRNAVVALGNSGDPVAIPRLIEALSDDSPLILGHAAWALGRVGLTAEVRGAIESAAACESDQAAKEEMEAALGGEWD